VRTACPEELDSFFRSAKAGGLVYPSSDSVTALSRLASMIFEAVAAASTV
jgi:hypothetical protein